MIEEWRREIRPPRHRPRDRELVTAGYRIVRVTWRQLESEVAAIVDSIRSLLRERHPVR